MRKKILIFVPLIVVFSIIGSLVWSSFENKATGQALPPAFDENFAFGALNAKARAVNEGGGSTEVTALVDELFDTFSTVVPADVKTRIVASELLYQSNQRDGVEEVEVVEVINGLKLRCQELDKDKPRYSHVQSESSSNDDIGRDSSKKFEVGVHGTIMFQDDFEPFDVVLRKNGFDTSAHVDRRYESGFGGRFTYNINENLALEAEMNFTPGTRTANELAQAGIIRTGPFSGGEKTQVLFGAKYGYRYKRIGIFGKVRPGFIRFNAFPVVRQTFIAVSPSGEPIDMLIISREEPATFFNVDVGGVFEYYPSKRTVIRFDIGDTIIHYNAQEPKEFNPTFNRHNLQMNLGFGFRF